MADATMSATEYALRALAQRAEVTAHNVANANTPGFRASRVEFESALAEALETGQTPEAVTATDAGGVPDAVGNTVDMEDEMVSMMKDNLLQSALVNAHNFKTGLMRNAITGR
jgi:flagellar basal-body rod protein FlgB